MRSSRRVRRRSPGIAAVWGISAAEAGTGDGAGLGSALGSSGPPALSPVAGTTWEACCGAFCGGSALGRGSAASLPLPAGLDGPSPFVPSDEIHRLNERGAGGFKIFQPDRRSQVDARPLAGSVETGDDQILFGRERIRRGELSPAAVGQKIPAFSSRLTLCDPVRIGEREQRTERAELRCLAPRGLACSY